MNGLESQAYRVIMQVIFYSGFAAPLVLGAFWRWWRSELGWSIAAKMIALSLALTPFMLAYWFGPIALVSSDGLIWFSIAALAAVPVILWWRVWVIFKAQRRGAKHV